MATVSFPWYVLPTGDWYLRSLVVKGSGIDSVSIYGSSDMTSSGSVIDTKTFSTPFSGKRINFSTTTPFEKIRAVFTGVNVKIYDLYYDVYYKRTI